MSAGRPGSPSDDGRGAVGECSPSRRRLPPVSYPEGGLVVYFVLVVGTVVSVRSRFERPGGVNDEFPYPGRSLQ
ncbi:MAG: hypothetical protein ACT4PW_14090 [Acidimicrobiia bacterium]